MELDMQLLLADFGKRKGRILSLSLHLYFTLNEVGCLGWFRYALAPVLVCPKMVLSLPLNSLRYPDCLPKLSIKLSDCQFKNRQ